MVKALADAKALHVRVDEEYDALQADGETLLLRQDGRHDAASPRPPARGRRRSASGRIASRPTTASTLTVYDGREERVRLGGTSGDLDSVVDFLRDDIGMKMPLAPLFSPQLRESAARERDLGDLRRRRRCSTASSLDHIAFQYGDGVGVQLWVPRSGDALPRRLVMTFEDARGRPQFRADFREWDLAPDVSDAVFAFARPEGARAVPFVLPKQPPAGRPADGEGSR